MKHLRDIVGLAAGLLLAVGMASPPAAAATPQTVGGGGCGGTSLAIVYVSTGVNTDTDCMGGTTGGGSDIGNYQFNWTQTVTVYSSSHMYLNSAKVSAGAYTGTGVAYYGPYYVIRGSQAGVYYAGFLCKPISYSVGVSVDLGATGLSNSNPLYSDLWVYSGSPGICPSSNFSVAKPRYLYQYN